MEIQKLGAVMHAGQSAAGCIGGKEKQEAGCLAS